MALYIDPNTGTMSATQSGSFVPFTGGAVTDYQKGGSKYVAPATEPVAPLTLTDAQKQAETITSGLVSPMSLADIQAREAQQKALSTSSAEAQYNPQIAAERKAGETTLSSAIGATGQSKGFNLSTAESAYLSAVQGDVNKRIQELENKKAAAISTGNFNAISAADTAIEKLNEYNNNLLTAKADYALKLMSQNVSERQLAMQERSQEFEQNIAEKNLAINLAQITGEYEGSPTYAATQAKIQNALAEANVTGFYNGKKTLAAVTADADIALKKQGLELDRAQLAETIRNNNLQASNKTTNITPTDAANQAVSRLVNLRNAGNLNDANYWAEVNTLGTAIGFDMTDEVQKQRMNEMVWKSMNGDQSAKNWIGAQGNQSMGSDFVIASPKTTEKLSSIASVLKKANNQEYIPGAGVQANMAKANKIINDLTVNMSPVEKANAITQAQKLVK